ncbi:MAG: hypothetical protein AB7G06_05215 [Bdellovibrionales bacterium]
MSDIAQAALIVVGGLSGIVVVPIVIELLKQPRAAMREARLRAARRKQRHSDFSQIVSWANPK